MTRIFISYAHEDIASARKLYEQLNSLPGVEVWFDKESLKPGQRWELAIKDAISGSQYFLLLISKNSTGKRGYYQREIRLALRVLEEVPDDKIFLIPIRLDDCQPHFEEINILHHVDFFPDWDVGLARVLEVLKPDTGVREDKAPTRVLKLRVHQAIFRGFPRLCYFINATNLSPNSALEITHVWYEDDEHHIPVMQSLRPLPVRLEPDQSWETWIDIGSLPSRFSNAYENFRARISTGAVFKSEANPDVPLYGVVPGGPIH